MRMSGIGSMMGGGMIVFGWFGALLVLALVVSAVVLLAKGPGGSGSDAILTVLAVVGGVALAGVAAMVLMRAGGMN